MFENQITIRSQNVWIAVSSNKLYRAEVPKLWVTTQKRVAIKLLVSRAIFLNNTKI